MQENHHVDPSEIWYQHHRRHPQCQASPPEPSGVVYRTGIIIIQLFVPAGSGSKLITETADKLRELFEFQDDDRLSYQAVSSIAVGEKNGWFQLNLQIPYRAL